MKHNSEINKFIHENSSLFWWIKPEEKMNIRYILTDMHSKVLTEEQRELLPLIRSFSNDYYLVGGTAIALYIGHRRSIDFDLFTTRNIKRRSIRNLIEKRGFVKDYVDLYFILKDYYCLKELSARVADIFGAYFNIGVSAFYQSQKPYEKTVQFLLTAWLYQFVKGRKGDLRYEALIGLGRMDILLIYHGHKYIIESKINRSRLDKTVEKAIDQLCGKYLLTEQVDEGYSALRKTPHENAFAFG